MLINETVVEIAAATAADAELGAVALIPANTALRIHAIRHYQEVDGSAGSTAVIYTDDGTTETVVATLALDQGAGLFTFANTDGSKITNVLPSSNPRALKVKVGASDPNQIVSISILTQPQVQ